MPLSLQDCLQQLTSLEILSADEIQTALSALPEEPPPRSVEQLVRELVRQNKLTAYQARVVLEGRAKSLMLGNYVVLDRLGKGGMGEVFKAQHRVMDRTVALKVLAEGLVESPDALQRFRREVRAAAKLTHPHVVAAYDAAEVEGVYFLVMEYVDGQDLSALVKRQGPLPAAQAVNCLLQAARGLEYAHQRGIVHRDIKPSNLLLERGGAVKILDMGLARIAAEAESGRIAADEAELTSSGMILGTVDYMAPEQAKDTKHADHRADIYSLGISLYYLLTGRPPYRGDSLVSKLMAHQTEPIPDLQKDVPGASGALAAAFRKMVAKLPEERYQTMSEVVAALEACQSPGGQAVSLPPAASEDAQLKDFLRHFQAQPQPQAKTGSSAKTVKPAVAVAAPVVPDEDVTLAGDSDTHPAPAASPPASAPPAQRRRSKRAARRAGPLADKRGVLIAAAAGVAIVVLATVMVTVFRGGRNKEGEANGRRKGPPLAKAPFTAAQAQAHQAAWVESLGVPVQFTNSLGIDFVLIPPGEFEMGTTQEQLDKNRAELEPRVPSATGCQRHRVRLTKPFYLATVEVSQSAYQAVMGTNPSYHSASGPGKDRVAGLDQRRLPAESLSAAQAEEFCRKLSEMRNEYSRGRNYRLPTEAEWEYACRAGTTTLFWTGDNAVRLKGLLTLLTSP